MVEQVVEAARLVVDAARVELERDVRGVDGDGDRSDVGDGVSQSVLVPAGDVRVAGDGSRVGRRRLARAILGRVRVGSLCLDATVVLDVPEKEVRLK